MKKLLILCIAFTAILNAQKKEISLEDIWSNGTFRTDRLESFHSMSTGDYYTILGINNATRSTRIDKYSYKTLEKVETIVDSKDLNELDYFESYEFNDDETKLLLGIGAEQIYRYSSRGIYYVYTMASKQLQLVSEHKIQEPTFSPDGKKVAYMYKNNIYIKELDTNTTVQITNDGKKNEIINGITDLVNEE